MSFRARLIAATAIVCAWAPCTASASAPRHFVNPPARVMDFHLDASNGYRIDVSIRSRRYLTLDVSNGISDVEYETRGKPLRGNGLEARLAGLGVVAVRFVPHGPKRQRPRYSNCTGPGPSVQGGTARGRIEFTGENGYTRLMASHARAEVVTSPRLTCAYVRHRRHRRRWIALLSMPEESEQPDFEATRYPSGYRSASRRVTFKASASSQRGRVSIFRSISVSSDLTSFQVPDEKDVPEDVTIAPPLPFSGTGTLQRSPESVLTWEGDLSVEFPGLRPISLTGPRDDIQYCALRGCFGQSSFGFE